MTRTACNLSDMTPEKLDTYATIYARLYRAAARHYGADLDRVARWYQWAETETFIAAYKYRNLPVWRDLPLKERADRLRGAVAALSPDLPWERNIAAALSVAAGGPETPVSTHERRNKAWRILCHGTAHQFDRKSGPKTTAFYGLLCGRWDVCLDRWMLRVLGLPEKLPYAPYVRLVGALMRAKRYVGTPYDVYQVQAIVWTFARDVLQLVPGEHLVLSGDGLAVAGRPLEARKARHAARLQSVRHEVLSLAA